MFNYRTHANLSVIGKNATTNNNDNNIQLKKCLCNLHDTTKKVYLQNKIQLIFKEAHRAYGRDDDDDDVLHI